MSKRASKRDLLELGESIGTFMSAVIRDLDGITERLEVLEANLDEVREVTAPGLVASDAFDYEDEVDEVEKPLGKAWRLNEEAGALYSAGGRSVAAVMNSLLDQLVRDGNNEPAVLTIHVSYDGVEPGFEEEGAYGGFAAVGV